MSRIKEHVSQQLERFPRVKHFVRKQYHRVNYHLYGDSGLRFDLHPEVELQLPETWANTAVPHDDLFFGYYDKTPWSPDGNRIALHGVTNEDRVDIVIVDNEQETHSVIGQSSSWNYQQGAMLQWLDDSRVIFNDVVDGKFTSKIVTIDGETQHVFELPVQSVHPESDTALSLNYRRLAMHRPQYGYSNAVTNFSPTQAASNDGIWRLDLSDNSTELVVSLERVITHKPREDQRDSPHWINHVFFSPSGDRCVFLHRWKHNRDRLSRLYWYDLQTDDLRILMDDEKIAHYCWLDNTTLLVYGNHHSNGKQYYVVDVESTKIEPVHSGTGINEFGDGHPSVTDAHDWVVTDTYPGKDRMQHLVIFQFSPEVVIPIGRFLAPLAYQGERSCDLHPRWHHNGGFIAIDSAHTGSRQTHLVDVRSVVENHQEPS